MAFDRRAAFDLFCMLAMVAIGSHGCAGSGESKETLSKSTSSVSPTTTSQAGGSGRYQLVVVAGHPSNPFLIDTATGCMWHFAQNEKTKRTTFIEVDVENLHWGWGSGAQQILAGQIDALNSSEDQKKVLKQNLQKTECGQFNVTLSSDRKAESLSQR